MIFPIVILASVFAQGNVALDAPRPIAAVESLWTEELTWMEVRDAVKAGKTTVIIATGGIEQNGPYVAGGKHNFVLQTVLPYIARAMGNTLIAPIVKFVPEGAIEPTATSHMRYPGTISVTEETFERLLTDICSSLRTHGFKNIVLIGDSGGNQTGMRVVAEVLNSSWDTAKSKVYFIPEYYDFDAVSEWLERQGIHEVPEGLHDDFAMTAMMMSVDPESVRTKVRIDADRFRINGIELAPIETTIEWGKKIIDFRAEMTVKAYRSAVSN